MRSSLVQKNKMQPPKSKHIMLSYVEIQRLSARQYKDEFRHPDNSASRTLPPLIFYGFWAIVMIVLCLHPTKKAQRKIFSFHVKFSLNFQTVRSSCAVIVSLCLQPNEQRWAHAASKPPPPSFCFKNCRFLQVRAREWKRRTSEKMVRHTSPSHLLRKKSLWAKKKKKKRNRLILKKVHIIVIASIKMGACVSWSTNSGWSELKTKKCVHLFWLKG